MMRSLYTAVSGLTNHQTKMDVIGNNIANINTTGYKSSRATFADTLSQTISGATAPTDNIGGTNAKQVGLGMKVSSIDTKFTAGSPSSTGLNTDLAISSDNGLFIVKSGDQTYYTRNGNFTMDADGNLVMNGSGLNVQGWNATDGVLTTGGATENLKIDMNSAMQPEATTSVEFAKNLSADDAEETIKTMKLTLSDGSTITVPTGDTTSYSIGDTVDTSTITSIDATLADGSTVTLSSGTYASGDTYTSSDTVSAVSLTFADGSTATGASGVSYDTSYDPSSQNVSSLTLTLSDGTTQSITTGGYAIGSTYGSLTVSGISATLADGTVVKVPSSSTSTYTVGSAYPDSTSVSSIGITLDDGTSKTLTTTQAGSLTYTIGSNYQSTISSLGLNTLGGTTATDTSGTSYTIGTSTYGTSNSTDITGITLTLADSDSNTTSSSGVYGASYTLGSTTYPSHTSIATVYDSLGATHSIPVTFQRTSSTDNEWLVSVAPGTYDSITIPNGVSTTMTFDGDTGKLTSGGSLNVTMDIPYPNGATQSQTINLDFNDTTQYSGETNVNVNDSDGYAAGFYKSMTIGSDGVITMTYTNGQKQSAGQIAIANFNNPGGLTKSGGSLYESSNNSGVAQVGTFEANGIDVTTGALEMSNVDTANEFSEMITTQRGFQANSKIITVADEMLETLVNMKR